MATDRKIREVERSNRRGGCRFRPTSLARFTVNKSEMLGKNCGVLPSASKTRSVKTIEGVSDAPKTRYAERATPVPTLTQVWRSDCARERVENEETDGCRGGVYLLYGPSVNQVFRSVSKDIAPGIAATLIPNLAGSSEVIPWRIVIFCRLKKP